MIDFIRLYYRDKSELENFLLDPQNFEEVNAVMEYHTGEINYPYTTRLETMDLGVSNKSGYVKNSLHKLYNFKNLGEEQNYNDFEYSKLCEMIDFLSNGVINAGKIKLTQFEFGINIDVNRLPEILVRRNFLMHNLEGGSSNTYQGKGEFKQFVHSNYFIKVYDKSKQFGLDSNVLRFEIKYMNAKEFQKLGIFNITDLKDKTNLRKLFLYLLKRFDELTIVDDFDETSIPNKIDYDKLGRYTNPIYWTEEIKDKHQQYKARHKKVFIDLLERNNLLKTKTYLRKLLIQKFIYLINN